MVFRDPEFDLPPNIILHERGSSPIQIRNERKSLENAYIDRSPPRVGRSLNESPVNIPLSNSSTPHMPSRIPVYYTEPMSENPKHRLDRYKQTRVITRRDDDRYFDKREPVHYTLSNRYQPGVYETFENRKQEMDVYDARKEKYFLKSTDRSLSPLPSRIRSRSSDRILDAPTKSVRYEDEYYSKSSNEDSDSQKHKNQSYFLNKSNPNSNITNANNGQLIVKESERYRDNIYIEKRNNDPRIVHNKSREDFDNQSQNESKNSSAIVNVCGNSEIVYVPMVKEEFIKRESQKTNTGTLEKEKKIRAEIFKSIFLFRKKANVSIL